MTDVTTTAPADEPEVDETETERATPLWQRLVSGSSAPIGLILVALIVVFSLIDSSAFLDIANARNIATDAAVLLVLATGETFVIITAGVDLSVGAVLVFSGVVAAKAKIPPLIVTLGTFGMSLGAALVITGGIDERSVPFKLVSTIGIGRAFGQVPWLVVIAFAVAIVFGVVLALTRFGRYTYAVGSNEEAARRAGVAVDRHLIKVYGLAGTLSGLAGFMSLARFATTTIGGHDTDNLSAIAAVVIGGTSLFGGIGTILGTVFGVFIPAVLTNGFIIAGVQPFWQEIAVGAVLIGAVYLDQLRRRSQYRR